MPASVTPITVTAANIRIGLSEHASIPLLEWLAFAGSMDQREHIRPGEAQLGTVSASILIWLRAGRPWINEIKPCSEHKSEHSIEIAVARRKAVSS